MFFFFFRLCFLSPTFAFHGTTEGGGGGGAFLTPIYHFHPLHRHLDISRAITAESSSLHIASDRTRTRKETLVSERKSLTTKLRALDMIISISYLAITPMIEIRLIPFKNADDKIA